MQINSCYHCYIGSEKKTLPILCSLSTPLHYPAAPLLYALPSPGNHVVPLCRPLLPGPFRDTLELMSPSSSSAMVKSPLPSLWQALASHTDAASRCTPSSSYPPQRGLMWLTLFAFLLHCNGLPQLSLLVFHQDGGLPWLILLLCC